MHQVPPQIIVPYVQLLQDSDTPSEQHRYYRKWLSYYWDFCHKYNCEAANPKSLTAFIEKLQSKKQSPAQQEQAKNAIELFYTMEVAKSEPTELSTTVPPEPTSAIAIGQPPSAKKSNPAWDVIYQQLTTQIKTRHYSPKTLKAYLLWLHQLQQFTEDKDPQHLSVDDVSAFLSYLATEQNVSAASQNQAFNALLFVFQHILKKDYKGFQNVIRAKRKPYIPVVLSREEVNKVIARLAYPYDLVAKLLYGCGLRISECLKIRIQDLNLEMGILTIHDGKGQKDRTVPLPQILMAELQQQIEVVSQQHQADLAAGYAGVFLMQALGTKYKNAAKEFVWQWLFPAKLLTFVPETNEYRRYHLHETHFQRAIKQAVQKAGIPKRASAHTFRHSFASHLLQANYDIRTIQQLLGHSDVRTTMIYTHTVKSQTLKEPKSPLDF